MPPVGFEPMIADRRRAAADLRFRPRGYWNRQDEHTRTRNFHDNANRTSEPALWAKSRKEAPSGYATHQHNQTSQLFRYRGGVKYQILHNTRRGQHLRTDPFCYQRFTRSSNWKLITPAATNIIKYGA